MANETEERARYIENLKSLGHRNIPIKQDGFFLDMYQRFRWEGWKARAASPVSAPTKPNIKIRCHDCGGFQIWRYVEDEDVFEVFHDCVSGKSAEKRKLREAVAPVSAEQPTKCPTCDSPDPADRRCLVPDHPHIYVDHDLCTDKFHKLAALSVASEDSATQPAKSAIEHMVRRFLAWKLPENFNPDGGISFTRDFNVNTPYPMKHEPVGTNLLDYTQAEAMVRHMLEGVPKPGSEDWMRKAAESSAYKLYPPTKYCTDNATRCNAEAIIREEFAKHYAVSQLSTEKKS